MKEPSAVLGLLEDAARHGWWVAILVALVLLGPTRVKEWLNFLVGVLYVICGVVPNLTATVVDRWYTKHSIESSIDRVSQMINEEASEIFPYTLKITWVNSDSVGAYIHNGNVVVPLKPYHEHHGRNLVHITLHYVKEGFLPTGQVLLDEGLRKACEYIMIGKIVRTDKRTNAYRYFMEEVEKARQVDGGLGADLERLGRLDEKGCLTRIFMRQVEYAAKREFPLSQVESIQDEIRQFYLYLYNVVTKALGQNVPLDFLRSTVRTGIVLVGRSEIMDVYGTDAYVRRIIICVQSGMDFIYVITWEDDHIARLLDIKQRVHGNSVTVIYGHRLSDAYEAQGMLLVCQPTRELIVLNRALIEDAKGAVLSIVPELKSGEIEIVNIAREYGVACKVAVRMRSGESSERAVTLCVGKSASRVKMIAGILAETVTFVPWSADIKDYIISALYPLSADDVKVVSIDADRRVADVEVAWQYVFRQEFGTEGINSKLASQLTGYLILPTVKERSIEDDPERELERLIDEVVREVRDKEVRIVNIARVRGVGAKVLVAWQARQEGARRAASVCRDRLDEVRERLDGEWIHCHDWYEDEKNLVVECLYPLHKEDVRDISVLPDRHLVKITVNSAGTSPPVWKTSTNMALARRLTGWSVEVVEGS